ncbi:hypothetical protein [Mucilaginibacter segetis]|uniref:Uncharacterized protein n=1 Tax=Mucilaginibacter segetis TaxID=2793071 RepID=A0A934PR93_9SPHI|nr:hypothetical protein [Mucilaginibacter segetis]MBK0379308.1 hypothetical protein [Mucilaginibacter segetis]
MPVAPNLSILTFFTKTTSSSEKVLFISVKPVADVFHEAEIFWYPGKGVGGKAQWIWEALNIKQWCACGTDYMMQQLFDEIITQKLLIIGTHQITLEIFPHELIRFENRPFKSRYETVSDQLKSNSLSGMPHGFMQQENLQYLSGYKTGSHLIKPLFPFGFFEQDFIYRKLKANIWGVKTFRRPYLTYRGVTKTSIKGIGSKQLVGFYQHNYSPHQPLTVSVVNERQEMIGQSIFPCGTPVFKIDLTEPVMKGAVQVYSGKVLEQENEFVLLQDIQINTNISSGNFKDHYGRNFMLGDSAKARPTEIDSFTWQRHAYADHKEADQKLSDLFRNVFNYLGPDILIADPYFIGNIKLDENGSGMQLQHCQAAMVNAILHTAIETGTESFRVMGYWGRASNQADNDDETSQSKIEQYFEKYDHYFQSFRRIDDVEKYLPIGCLFFYNAREEFHNRYWFGLKKTDEEILLEKVVIMTNSLGNINELDIMPIINETQRRQIAGKYSEIFSKAELKLNV